MRKTYASQESVERTLTQAELAAPFQLAPADPARLDGPMRQAILAAGENVEVVGYFLHEGGRRRWVQVMEVRP